MHSALAALLALLAAARVHGGYDWNGVLNNKNLQTGDVRAPLPVHQSLARGGTAAIPCPVRTPCCGVAAESGISMCRVTSVPAVCRLIRGWVGAVSASARQPCTKLFLWPPPQPCCAPDWPSELVAIVPFVLLVGVHHVWAWQVAHSQPPLRQYLLVQ